MSCKVRNECKTGWLINYETPKWTLEAVGWGKTCIRVCQPARRDRKDMLRKWGVKPDLGLG